MAITDVVLASHRSGDRLRTAARTLVVAVRPVSCLWEEFAQTAGELLRA
ncbi:hypothetical protein [Microbispora sp. NPDC049125]